MSDAITIVTVNWYSARYLSPLYSSLVRLAADPERLHFLVIDNTNGHDHELRDSLTGQHVEVVPHDPGSASGSGAHASGLDRAMRRLDTPWVLITDPDVALFQPDWDDFVISLTIESDASGMGAPYPAWKLGKYHDFPSPIFGFFDTEVLLDLDASWEPFPSSHLRRGYRRALRNIVRLGGFANRERLLRRPALFRFTRWMEAVTGVTAPDVGWRLAAEARQRGLAFVMLDFLRPDHARATGPSMHELSRTFEVFGLENRPILAHKYSSANRIWGAPESTNVELWEKLTTEYLATVQREAGK